jgi:protoheme IX farnesyltransferase
MLPSVRGLETTRKQIFLYTLTLIPAVGALFVFDAAGWVYLTISMFLTLYFAWLAFRLYSSRENQLAMPLFYYSCFYLFGVFGALAIDKLLTVL